MNILAYRGITLMVCDMAGTVINEGGLVYKTLYEFVCNSAEEHGNVYAIRLYVDVNNKIAQQVYKNLGMHKSNYDMFEEVIII